MFHVLCRQLQWQLNCAVQYTYVWLPLPLTSKWSCLWWLRSTGRSRMWWVSTANMWTSSSGYVAGGLRFDLCLCSWGVWRLCWLKGSIFVWFYSLLLSLGKNSELCDVLQELQIFSMRLEEVAIRIPIPREVYLILWESIIRLTCGTFVEG